MASVIHIAEVAALLAIAYVVGWAIGYLAHRLAAGSHKPVENAIPADRLAAVKGEGEALVKAPVIAPLPIQPAPPVPVLDVPVSPAPEPVIVPAALAQIEPELPTPAVPPAVLEPTLVPTADAMPAAPLAQTVAPLESAAPVPAMEPVIEIAPPAPVGPLIVMPVVPEPEPQPAAPFTATPSTTPGEAWSGEIRGRVASRLEAAKVEPVAEPVAEIASEPATPVTDETPVEPAPILVTAPVIEPAAGPAVVAVVPEPAAPVEQPGTPPARPAYDEDAAMRAIEGGWSRVRARAMPGAPELSDVGAAVAAAQSAVEQVLAQAGIDPVTTANTNKPIGLPRPRGGRKDDLKQISGLTDLDESTLNNLGIYHFHQIAQWDETEVLWMENHVFARGRIGRETWQDQARRLADTVAS